MDIRRREKRPGFPVLELLRYSGDGVELTGAAADMEGVQALRTPRQGPFPGLLGDVQQIPGGGLRFSLSIRRSPVRASVASLVRALAGKDDGPWAGRRAVIFLLALLAWGRPSPCGQTVVI